MNIISNASRQVILDTETTGMNQGSGAVYLGHRIIEIGCVEVINRRLTGRYYHQYINPGQAIDPEAIAVHGITDERVANEPRFHQIAQEFIDFISGAEIVAHNANFDVSFMDHEFSLLQPLGPKTRDICDILDSLDIAKVFASWAKKQLRRSLQTLWHRQFPPSLPRRITRRRNSCRCVFVDDGRSD